MLSEHFSEEEFACHHCGELKINPRLIELLEQLRYNIGGYPLTISSGYRCPYWNEHEGGASLSQHVLGNAADILIPEQLDSIGEFEWYANQLSFDGVGVYPRGYNGKDGWLHLDVRCGGVTTNIDDKAYWEG